MAAFSEKFDYELRNKKENNDRFEYIVVSISFILLEQLWTDLSIGVGYQTPAHLSYVNFRPAFHLIPNPLNPLFLVLSLP